MNKYYLLASLTICFSQVFAQYTLPADPTGKKITPPSPDVWQFAKYGEYPVSRETGVPGISIPIYTVQNGSLSVPITVSYHAAGNRVDDIASWVGLGWTLSAGGVVSRTVKGRPDESANGILNLDKLELDAFIDEKGVIDQGKIEASIHPLHNEATNIPNMLLRQMMDGVIDSEPDLFNYNVNGYSGRFFLDPQGNAVAQPKTDCRIEVTIISDEITQVLITTPDGVKYFFTEKSVYIGDGIVYNSAWYLTRIESSNNTENIVFTYQPLNQVLDDPQQTDTYNISYMGSTSGMSLTPTVEHTFSTSQGTFSSMKVPATITYPSGKVVFNATNTRTDSQLTRLTSIDIFNADDLSNATKQWIFDNDYYFSTTQPCGTTLCRRMKLKSLREKGKSGNPLPPYEFTYQETGQYELPPRLSTAQDYWGYYNGQVSNPTLVPKYRYKYENLTPYYIGDADRNANAEHMKAGIIRTIKYPTSGLSEFVFDANTVRNSYLYTPIYQRYYQAGVYTGAVSSTDSEIFTASETANAVAHFEMFAPQGQTVTGQVYLKVQGSSDYIFFRSFTTVAAIDVPITVSSGVTYQLYAQATGNTMTFATVRWEVEGPPETIVENKIVGGLRIKNIKNYDYTGALITQKHFSYDTPLSPGVSSASYNVQFLPSPEDYLTYTSYQREAGQCIGGSVWDLVISLTNHPRNQSSMPVSDVLTYEYVTERNEDGTNLYGKSVFRYSVQAKDEAITSISNTALLDRGWMRGQLLRQTEYDKFDQTVHDTQYKYDSVEYEQRRIIGLKVNEKWKILAGNGGECFHWISTGEGTCIMGCTQDALNKVRYEQILLRTYDELFLWKRLISKTETSDGITTKTTYEYDPQLRHTNVTAVQLPESNGNRIREEFRYAHEIGDATLVSKNIVGVSTQWDHRVNGTIMKGSRLSYGTLNGLYLPVKYEDKIQDGSYQVLNEIVAVNAAGKIEEYKRRDGIVTALKWDGRNEFPLGEAINAKSTQIAFTSFESGVSEGGWTYTTTDAQDAKTGKRSFLGSSISKSGMPVGNYILSLWAKKSGLSNGTITISGISGSTTISTDNFIQVSLALNSVTSVSITLSGVRIDDIRIQPANSQITTFTNLPSVGVSAVTDPNGKIMYYEYDAMNRLNLIRDEHKNILKKYTYNFKDQK